VNFAKRHFFLAAAVGLVVLMVLAVLVRAMLGGDDEKGGGSARGPGGGRAQTVQVAAVGERAFVNQIQALGVARGRRSVDITSSTTELITRVLFSDGQAVRAGAPLVELQAREEDAGIVTARANLAQAQRDYDRWLGLADRGVAPRVQAEQAEQALATAQAGLEAAQARRGDRVIRAPFSGVMGLSTVTPGTLVNPGSTIATLDDISVIRVDFPVPERYLSLVRTGTPIIATADALPGETFQGSIALIDTRVDQTTRAVTARAEFANAGGRLRPGMSIRVRVQEGRRQAMAAPEAAVLFEGDQAFVYRAVNSGDETQAQRVVVETGAVEGGFIEILGGVAAGDQIIAGGLNRLQPGAPVRVEGQGAGQGQGDSGRRQGARP
jgi:membrane fusion protein (multidrug efflux system)